MRYLLVVLLVACGGAQHRPTNGGISGLARDHDSGDSIPGAEVRIRAKGDMQALRLHSGRDGHYNVGQLPPGLYSLNAWFAGQPINIENIQVRAGEPAIVDLVFTLGRPDPIDLDFGDPRIGAIDHYRHADTSLIEGTISDSATNDRVAGAVITAIGPGDTPTTLQAVSDDQGRYRFDPVPPGTYTVSAYYSIGGRGQVEIRRSKIRVAAAEGVVVPLIIEIAKQ